MLRWAVKVPSADTKAEQNIQKKKVPLTKCVVAPPRWIAIADTVREGSDRNWMGESTGLGLLSCAQANIFSIWLGGRHQDCRAHGSEKALGWECFCCAPSAWTFVVLTSGRSRNERKKYDLTPLIRRLMTQFDLANPHSSSIKTTTRSEGRCVSLNIPSNTKQLAC